MPVAYAEADLFYKVDSFVDIKVPCYNSALSSQAECSPFAVCNLTVNYPNGTNYIKNIMMTNSGQYFNYTMFDTSTSGEYNCFMSCNDNSTVGFGVFSIMLNNSGSSEKPYALSILFIILPLLFAIICLIGGLGLDGENKLYMNEGGQYQLEINYGWYTKIILIFFSMLFFWVSTFMAWQTSDLFVLTTMITLILRSMFVVETILIGISIPLFAVLSLVKHVSNIKWLKEVERGFTG